MKKAVLDFQPDYIFHLAAQPLVRLSYEIPSETFEVNAIGTANLLDAIRLLDKKCNVILITTDKVYHNNEWEHPYKETDKLGGYDPYSASKACCELVIDSYKNSFFNLNEYNQHQKAIAVGRAGNVIGGGDWSKDRLIPDIAIALNANKDVVIRNPKAVRPWQHVIDPINGYLLLGLKGFILNIANPAVIFYWLSILSLAAQSVPDNTKNPNTWILFFISILLGTYFSIDVLKVFTAKRLRTLVNQNLLNALNILIGLIFFLTGIFQIIKNFQIILSN